MSTNIKTCFQW